MTGTAHLGVPRCLFLCRVYVACDLLRGAWGSVRLNIDKASSRYTDNNASLEHRWRGAMS